ncbi:hypothetical protein TEA_011867 [Camellia sinensis var. sinensis]|uniref:Uncharacterized protein n=1 Tax=Camellia sinensis var. sinensis TaxID=542762 RepID=A0A4S4DXB4_CAMSN|nr:hypothetical protein TEA_011867 [Camellia sinensis var. sinensis]
MTDRTTTWMTCRTIDMHKFKQFGLDQICSCVGYHCSCGNKRWVCGGFDFHLHFSGEIDGLSCSSRFDVLDIEVHFLPVFNFESKRGVRTLLSRYKTYMEKKQLDLDAPLLSVRRFSSRLASLDGSNKKKTEKSLPHRQQSLPVYKSDWELGEVTKPAAVPFIWEQIPGRAKCGNESGAQSPVEPSNTPRLPPGRTLDVVSKQFLEDVYEDHIVQKPPIESNLWERLNKGVNEERESGSESEDDEFSDAPDTLSPTQTFSMNCSVSDLSGYGSSDMKPCGTFSADLQTRDLMMNRFLPAAKAMVLDTPQYVPKKQQMTPERPKPVRKENSLCLLNPVPGMKGMKVRTTQVPTTSSAKEVNRLARAAYSGPLTQPDKHYWGASYKQKLDSGPRSHSHELHKVKSKPIGESKRLSYSGNLHMMRRSSPYSSFSKAVISPYQNEASKSPFREEPRFVGVTNNFENVKAMKGYSNFQDVSCHQRYKRVSGSTTPTVEKTLYIDSVNIVELPVSESISSGAESIKGRHGNFSTSVDSSTIEETTASGSVDIDTPCSAQVLDVRSQEDRMEGSRHDQVRSQQSKSLFSNNEHSLNADNEVNPSVGSMLSPLPPPLPKSPSESWLWRTLPSISLRHPKKQHGKASNTGTKWETIVKTSNVHHDHVRYSEAAEHYMQVLSLRAAISCETNDTG